MLGPIKITLGRDPKSNRASIVLRGPKDETESHWFDLPWLDNIEWQAVLLSLELQEEDSHTWPQQDDVRKKAQELGLFLQKEGRPSNERFKKIGQKLYAIVFGSPEIRSLMDRLLDVEGEMPVLEFHIPDEGSILQSYPWELLYDSKGFLFDGTRAALVRHVDFDKSNTPLELTGCLEVLYVAPRPNMSTHKGYDDLPILEGLRLEYLNCAYPKHFALKSLSPRTLDSLQKLVRSESPTHVVHIDTHGGFGWLCCKQLNLPGINPCPQCGNPQSKDQRNQGYLAFETADGDIDWISGEELGTRLNGTKIQVIVLSACRSGMVGEESTFNSVAGALVKNQIPAVVAMQFYVSAKQAENFIESFYLPVIKGIPLTQAVAEVRTAFKDSWYRPVLYLRTDLSNYQGKIFELKSKLGPPKKLTPREEWRARLGFRLDPFLYPDGGKDPDLINYYDFKMKRFSHVFDLDIDQLNTIFVFGPPGSGKSSMRNVISQLCRNSPDKKIFLVVHQDFRADMGVEVEECVIQVLETILKTLYELVNEEAISLPAEADDPSRIIRNQLWRYVAKYEKDSLRRYTLENFLRPDPEAEEDLPTDVRELLVRFCRNIIKLFGYDFVYILVDPDDEIAWPVLESLLSTRRLLELSEDKVAFKFFLSLKFREQVLQIPWIDQEQSRMVYSLEWPDVELRTLLQNRLLECSKSRYSSLAELSEDNNLDDRVILLAKRSPRELIAICDQLFSEHTGKWPLEDDKESLLIKAEEIAEVLNPREERRPKSTLERRIAQGESEKLELKSTMQCNLETKKRDEKIERSVVKTLCGFMNTDGGTLIIGVDDVGKCIGLESDFSTLHPKRQNQDGFEQRFGELIEQYLGLGVKDYIWTGFEFYQDKPIYIVDVQRSSKPVYCLFDGEHKFCIRVFTSTRVLDSKETVEYCTNHFAIGS